MGGGPLKWNHPEPRSVAVRQARGAGAHKEAVRQDSIQVQDAAIRSESCSDQQTGEMTFFGTRQPCERRRRQAVPICLDVEEPDMPPDHPGTETFEILRKKQMLRLGQSAGESQVISWRFSLRATILRTFSLIFPPCVLISYFFYCVFAASISAMADRRRNRKN